VTQALIIAVNYRGEREALKLVNDLLSQSKADRISTLLVDNGPERHLAQFLQSERPVTGNVSVLTPESNLGYFGGAQFAVAHYLMSNAPPDWTAVTNVDLAIPSSSFFEQLFARYQTDAPAVVAPSILLTRSGRDQNPFLRFRPSSWRMHFLAHVFSNRVTGNAYQRLAVVKEKVSSVKSSIKRSHNSPHPTTIYAAHGSFMLFHKSYFAAGGTLRHGAFLFGEEIFVAETARRLGLRTIHDPSLVVLHRGSDPSGAHRSAELMSYLRDASAFNARTYF